MGAICEQVPNIAQEHVTTVSPVSSPSLAVPLISQQLLFLLHLPFWAPSSDRMDFVSIHTSIFLDVWWVDKVRLDFFFFLKWRFYIQPLHQNDAHNFLLLKLFTKKTKIKLKPPH
jgi:hypothetical protein